MKCLHNQSLVLHNSFNIQATCPELYLPESVSDLQSLPLTTDKSFYILGDGSNTLFVDDKAPLIIKPNFRGIEIVEHNEFYSVKVGASENWHNLVKHCIGKQIFGLENLALIPGSVGAAPVQNIGAYGVEFADFCHEIVWFDLSTQESKLLTKSECNFSYRESIFKQALYNKGIIISVVLRFPKKWSPNLKYSGLDSLPVNVTANEVMQKVIELRTSKLPDPRLLPNAGSFFKNPVVTLETYNQLLTKYPKMPSYQQNSNEFKLAAGWLIDQSGLKGYRVGKVGIHNKQALVLVNYDGGSGLDIVCLAQYIQSKVFSLFGVKLEPEVRTVSESGEVPFIDLPSLRSKEP